ncbi:MAG: hypothetical protein KBF45_08335 [Cyclobacteriaceae bacterium]|jgi:hypothetical protein|nr:hypothetical protein [Cyclobacteriaceae bacterium]
MKRVIFSLTLLSLSLLVSAQSKFLPSNLLVATGNNQLISKSTKVRNPSTQSLSIGAEWDWKIYDRVGVNSSILSGIYFPSFTLTDGVRPFINMPVTLYYRLSTKVQFNLGFFYRRDFYKDFRTNQVEIGESPDFHDWELPVTSRGFIGATGSFRYSISQRLSASLDGIYIPNVNVKAVSNDPFIPNEKYYNLSAQLSLFFNPF